MNTITKGATGTQVKIMQALLCIHGFTTAIDGSCGPSTVAALKQFQTKHKLAVDGSCGPATWAALGVAKPFSNRICTFKIPLSAISAQAVLCKNYQKYNVDKFCKENPQYNFLCNAAMFDMKTLRNVTDMVLKGKLDNGGNYSDKGIAFCNDRKTGSLYYSTTANSVSKPVDFIGGAPTLILNGVKNMDMKGLTAAYANSITKRICLGCDEKYLYIMITLNNCNLSQMITEGLNQKIKTLINMDGGGSQSLDIAGSYIIKTDGRSTPSVLAFHINPF